MTTSRRNILKYAGLAASTLLSSKAATTKPGMPGPFPGRVVGVEHPASIVGGAYQAEPVRQDDGEGHDRPHRRAELDGRMALLL